METRNLLWKGPTSVRQKSTFTIPGMDCPSEERIIRLALEPIVEVDALQFDLDERTLVVVHTGEVARIVDGLTPLGMRARLEGTAAATDSESVEPVGDPAPERRVLKQLLAINGVMFVVELGLGFAAQSTGLIADSLDMLADALVYGISLYAVGRALADQSRAARASGWLQVALASGALFEVGRRALGGSEPVEALMIGVALVALAANMTCVALLARHRKGGVHLKASWIFSTNDAIANLGVIFAGVLVAVTGSAVPDLVVGAAVGVLVLSGGVRILRLPKQ